MKSRHRLQKVLFGIATLNAVLALVMILASDFLMPKLSFNAAWIFAISLPVLLLSSLACFGLFLLVRLFQGQGLSRPFIIAAALCWVLYAGFAALRIVATRNPPGKARSQAATALAALVTNPPAFFDRLDQLAPLDAQYRSQAESLIGYQAFRRPNPAFVSNYFARASRLVPPGPWIPRSLFFGIQELAPGTDPIRLSNLTQVLRQVADRQPDLLQQAFTQREQTNTLRGFILDEARTATPPGLHDPILQLLPQPRVP